MTYNIYVIHAYKTNMPILKTYNILILKVGFRILRGNVRCPVILATGMLLPEGKQR